MIDTLAKELRHNGEVIKVGIKAFELLILLLKAKGEAVTMQSIEEELWSSSEEVSLGAVRVYVATLKRYFPSIENIRGVGYRFR